MRKVSHSALVPYSATQMYALVEDIEAYPSFLPWCSNATVHSMYGNCVEASLEIRRSGMVRTFRTRNTLQPGAAMGIALVDGPFRHLSGQWLFQGVGDGGSKVLIAMEFEFANPLIDAVFGRFFEATCVSMIDSFTRRAQEIYG